MLFSICFVLVQFIHMMTVDSATQTLNYKVKVSGAGTAKSNDQLQGHLWSPDGKAELATGSSTPIIVQILKTNTMTVGMGHPDRF
jgi:hypothetical protein